MTTKHQLNKAGEVLRARPDDSSSLSLLSEWRANHVHALGLAFKLVQKYTKKVGNNALYGQRLKRVSSIINKLRRNQTMKLSRMQDIGGCRVILSDYEKVFSLFNLLKKSKSILPNERNYIHYPKDDGYRSIHLIYKCSSKVPTYAGLSIEIQLRTKLQHAWATTVEIVDTFEGQTLKLGGGSEPWKEFFRLVSDEFALIEKLPIMDRNIYDQRSRLQELTSQLDVINKLRSYTHTIQLSERNEVVRYAEFSILVLNLHTNSGNLKLYNKLDEAQAEYLKLEKQHIDDEKVNILMLKMADVKQIKESYPNYFADSAKFITTLEKVLKT